MFMQKSIKIFHSVQEIRPFSLFQNLALGKASTDDKCHFAIVSLFSEFEPRQKLNQSQMSFDNLMGYILSISMCMQNFIFHSVQEIAPLLLMQNLELGNEKCHFAISWARSCQYQCLRNSLSKYSTQFKREGHFHFFRIWRSAKPRPMINVILQFVELDLVNINVSAKFYQNIPNGLRVKIHCFQIWTSAKPRPILNVIWLSQGLHHVNINVYANFITIFHSVQEIGPFSLFQNSELGKT